MWRLGTRLTAELVNLLAAADTLSSCTGESLGKQGENTGPGHPGLL